jgi:hypothetical protein
MVISVYMVDFWVDTVRYGRQTPMSMRNMLPAILWLKLKLKLKAYS